MKKIISICVFTLTLFSVHAADKIYTEDEFKTKLKEAVEKKISLIKKKSLTQFATELLEKEEKLQLREEALVKEAEQLKISEKSLLKNMKEFESSKNRIIGCIDKNKKNQLMRVQQLVSVISGMKPQKAAELLSVQESEISVKLIEKIDPAKASKIFNLMDKEVSARLQKQYLNMQQ